MAAYLVRVAVLHVLLAVTVVVVAAIARARHPAPRRPVTLVAVVAAILSLAFLISMVRVSGSCARGHVVV